MTKLNNNIENGKKHLKNFNYKLIERGYIMKYRTALDGTVELMNHTESSVILLEGQKAKDFLLAFPNYDNIDNNNAMRFINNYKGDIKC